MVNKQLLNNDLIAKVTLNNNSGGHFILVTVTKEQSMAIKLTSSKWLYLEDYT